MVTADINNTINVSTKVTINGMDVNDYLHEMADIAHEALVSMSIFRQENNLPDSFFDNVEGPMCRLLNFLND